MKIAVKIGDIVDFTCGGNHYKGGKVEEITTVAVTVRIDVMRTAFYIDPSDITKVR
jgi:hypothetical protein